MTDEDTITLAHTIAGILDAKHREFYCPLDPRRRAEDHEWVLARREKERARAEFWRQMTLHAAKWGMVSVLTVLAYALWLLLKHELMR